MTAADRPSSHPQTPDFALGSAPAGIGGWLLLFTIGQVISLFAGAAQLPHLTDGFADGAWELGRVISLYRPLVVVETMAQLLLLVGSLVGLYLLLRHDRRTPRFYTGFLLALAVFGLLEAGGIQVVFPQMIALVQKAGESTAELVRIRTTSTATGLRTALMGLVWALYWQRSQRVANTFGRPEPEAFAAATPESSAPAA